jgi:hypothetical protein
VARIVILCLILFGAQAVQGQHEKYIFEDLQRVDAWTEVDSAALFERAKARIRWYWKQGYLFAGIDSITQSAVYLHRGDRVLLTKSAQMLNWTRLVKQADQQLEQSVNGGYPFAQVVWDSVGWQNDRLHFTFRLDKGPMLLFDSLVLLRPIKTKPMYIQRMLDIEAGTLYSERNFQTISDKMRRVPFLSLNRPPDVSFQSSSVWTYLDVEERAQSSLQGVLGVLPNQSTGEGVLITGNLDLHLVNLFKTGKQLDFKWAQFAEQSQRLDAAYYHPFIAGTSFHLTSQFSLIKQDTSFLNREIGLGGSFFISPDIEMGVGFEQTTANILTGNVDRIVTQNWIDFDQDWYTLSVKHEDHSIGRAKPFLKYSAGFSIGTRRVNRNFRLPQDVYDTIRMQTTNMKTSARLEMQRSLSPKTFIYADFNAANVANKQDFKNQLYRVGGLQTLRGFNEQFFFTSSFVITQLEWRLFFEEESYLFAFYDQGFLHTAEWETPIGLGGGFSLLTSSGLFSFVLAVGKSDDIPFELANMKIHFGYLSRF